MFGKPSNIALLSACLSIPVHFVIRRANFIECKNLCNTTVVLRSEPLPLSDTSEEPVVPRSEPLPLSDTSEEHFGADIFSPLLAAFLGHLVTFLLGVLGWCYVGSRRCWHGRRGERGVRISLASARESGLSAVRGGPGLES
jgi:hypothetical protein